MIDLKKIIKDIDRLEPIPQAVQKVLSIVNNPDSSISELTDVVQYEPSLTANLLKICNSPYTGLTREVDSVHHAVALLGMNQVGDLILLAGVSQKLSKEQKGYDLKPGELWKHSVSSALLSRELAKRAEKVDEHFVFTAALLKDMGKLILSQYVEDSFKKINHLVTEENFSFREAEKKVIGIDHAELGGMVMEKWKFSKKMVSVVSNHHLSDTTSAPDPETSVIYMGDILCMMMGIGVGADGLAYRFYKDVLTDLKLSEKDIQGIMADFVIKLKKVESLYALS